MWKIFIVDDHRGYREGLKMLIESTLDMKLAGEAGSGSEVMDALERSCPDLILMDINMPEENGIHLTKRVKDRFPSVHVLMLTMFSSPSMVEAALNAGAAGYLLKGGNYLELLEAIRATILGDHTAELN